MISKSKVGMLLAVAALLIATPSATVLAASSSSTKSQIKKYYNQLKKLPTAATPAGKVSKLVLKLTKLDPKKANKYYKLGLTKITNLGGTASGNASKIAIQIAKILKKSDLSSSQIKKINKQVVHTNENYIPPPDPTPPVS